MKCHDVTEKAIADRNEAANAFIKLDDVRIMLNKLMGPNGPMSQAERHKFLPNGGDGDFTIDGPRGVPPQYGQQQPRGGNRIQALDEGGDDEFWYQTPKGGAQPGYGG